MCLCVNEYKSQTITRDIFEKARKGKTLGGHSRRDLDKNGEKASFKRIYAKRKSKACQFHSSPVSSDDHDIVIFFPSVLIS